MDENKTKKLGNSSSIVIRNKTYDSLSTLNELQNKSIERIENQNRNTPATIVENELSTKKEIQTGLDNKAKSDDTYDFGSTNYLKPKINISSTKNNKAENISIKTSNELKEQAKERIENQNQSVPKTMIENQFSTKKEIQTSSKDKTENDTNIVIPSFGIKKEPKEKVESRNDTIKASTDKDFSIGEEIKTGSIKRSRFETENNNSFSNDTIKTSTGKEIKTGSIKKSEFETETKKNFSTDQQIQTGKLSAEDELKKKIHVAPRQITKNTKINNTIFEAVKFRIGNKIETEVKDTIKSNLDEQDDLGTDDLSAMITVADKGIRGAREVKRISEKLNSRSESKRYYNNTSQIEQKPLTNTVEENEKEYKIHSQIRNDTIKTQVKEKYNTHYSLSENASAVDKSKRNYEVANKTIGNSIRTATDSTTTVNAVGNTAKAGVSAGTKAVTTTVNGGSAVATASAGAGVAATASVGALPVVAVALGIVVIVILVMCLLLCVVALFSPSVSNANGTDIDETKWITEKITLERENLLEEIEKIYNDNKNGYSTIIFSNTLNSSSTTLNDSNVTTLGDDLYTVDDYVQSMQPVFHTLLYERYELSPSDSEMEEVFNELWGKMNSLTTQEKQQTVIADTGQNNEQNEESTETAVPVPIPDETESTDYIVKTLTISLNTNGYYDLLNSYYVNDINILEAKTDITDAEKERLSKLNEYYTLCTTYAEILQESGAWLESGITGSSAYIPEGGYMPSEAFDDATVAAIFAEANKWLGTPYELPPNMPNTFDCSGFVWYVFQYSGVKNWSRTTAQGIFDQCTPIAVGEAKAGDLVFFQGTYNAGRTVTHIGIYCGDGTMIHAGNPVKRASINTPYWQEHFYSFGRLN